MYYRVVAGQLMQCTASGHSVYFECSAQEQIVLDKCVETALAKMSKVHDLLGRLEQYVGSRNKDCRAKRTVFGQDN